MRALCRGLRSAACPRAATSRQTTPQPATSRRGCSLVVSLSRRPRSSRNIQLRVMAKDAEESARHVHATAAVMVKLAGDHK